MPHSAIRPRWANDVVITASWFMNRRSQASAIGTAMPATAPLIAAITGLRIDIGYVYTSRSSASDGSPGSSPAGAQDRLGLLVARRRVRRRR